MLESLFFNLETWHFQFLLEIFSYDFFPHRFSTLLSNHLVAGRTEPHTHLLIDTSIIFFYRSITEKLFGKN